MAFAHVVQLLRTLDMAFLHFLRLLHTYTAFGIQVGIDREILSRWSNITVRYTALVVYKI